MKLPDKRLTLKNVYVEFKKENLEICKKYGITYKKFNKVCKLFNSMLIDKLIYDAYFYNMGSNLGWLSIKAGRTSLTKPKIDFANTKKLGFTVYFLNEHSNYYYYYTYWKKGNTMNIKSFQFKLSKPNKRKLIDAVKNKTIRVL